jgi:hypothetical protein
VTPRRQWLDAPRPWHLLLGPAVPLLAMLRNNTSIWPPEIVIGPCLIAASLALLLWLLIVPFAHDPRRAALAVTFSMLAVMSHIPLLQVTLSLGIVQFVPLVYLGVLFAAAAIVRSSRAAIAPTIFANRALVITVLFLTVPIAWGEVARTRTVADLSRHPLWSAARCLPVDPRRIRPGGRVARPVRVRQPAPRQTQDKWFRRCRAR